MRTCFICGRIPAYIWAVAVEVVALVGFIAVSQVLHLDAGQIGGTAITTLFLIALDQVCSCLAAPPDGLIDKPPCISSVSCSLHALSFAATTSFVAER